MAASKKKVVTKDDLRRFMKEKQSLSKTSSKKVDHPLAKYNALNQLVCVLCNNVIKNDIMWAAHIHSRQHKEKAAAFKTQGPVKPTNVESTAVKRKAESGHIIDTKKKKTDPAIPEKSKGLPSDFFDDELRKKETKEKAKAAFLAGYSSSESSSEEEEEEKEQDQEPTSSSSSTSKAAAKRGLPDDFFDSGQEPTEDDEEEKDELHNKKMSEVLPEGFFDDPKMDAKVRKVEYRDKMEDEWDLFQKEMKEQNQVSEVLMEEDDEQANVDRYINELDDQMHRWQEVENLHVKKETILKSSKDGQKSAVNEEDLEEDDLDALLGWRAKKVMK